MKTPNLHIMAPPRAALSCLALCTSFLLLLIGCTRYETIYDCIVVADFFYNNKTPFTIKGVLLWTDNGLRTEPILPYEKIEIRRERLGGCQSEHTFYVPPIQMTDSTRIVFDDLKFLIYEKESRYTEEGFTVIANYSYRKIKQLHYEFTYAFTEADYNNATPLVFGEDLIGSVWRCTEGEGLQEGLDYTEFRIISKTQLQGWAKWEEEPSPELYFTADYRIERESLLFTDFGQTITATLTDDYSGLITNINEEGECVFYKQ